MLLGMKSFHPLAFTIASLILFVETTVSRADGPSPMVREVQELHLEMEQKIEANLNEIEQLEEKQHDFIQRKNELIPKIELLKKEETLARNNYKRISKEGALEIYQNATLLAKVQKASFQTKGGRSSSVLQSAEKKYEKVQTQVQAEIKEAREKKLKIQHQRSELKFELESLLREKKGTLS